MFEKTSKFLCYSLFFNLTIAKKKNTLQKIAQTTYVMATSCHLFIFFILQFKTFRFTKTDADSHP